jgi:hypothetical protein
MYVPGAVSGAASLSVAAIPRSYREDRPIAETLVPPQSANRDLYCGPVLRHPAGLIQAANFRSAVAF